MHITSRAFKSPDLEGDLLILDAIVKIPRSLDLAWKYPDLWKKIRKKIFLATPRMLKEQQSSSCMTMKSGFSSYFLCEHLQFTILLYQCVQLKYHLCCRSYWYYSHMIPDFTSCCGLFFLPENFPYKSPHLSPHFVAQLGSSVLASSQS